MRIAALVILLAGTAQATPARPPAPPARAARHKGTHEEALGLLREAYVREVPKEGTLRLQLPGEAHAVVSKTTYLNNYRQRVVNYHVHGEEHGSDLVLRTLSPEHVGELYDTLRGVGADNVSHSEVPANVEELVRSSDDPVRVARNHILLLKDRTE